MSTPRSLPTTDSQRIAAQLPFGPTPTVTSPAMHRMQSQSRARPHRDSTSNTSTTSGPHNRSGSIVSSRSRTQPSLLSGELFSPPPPLPLISPRTVNNTTSPGVQPSSSLFNPPIHYIPSSPTAFVRPSSPGSIISSEAHAMSPVRLGPLLKHDAQDPDYSSSINLSSTEDLNNATAGSKTNKHSREPLLPIGANRPRKSTLASRPSISVTNPYGRDDNTASTGGKMRGSFEKLFRRGSSHEGGKKGASPVLDGASSSIGADSPANCIPRSRQASPVTPHVNPAMTFDITAMNKHAPMSPYKHHTPSPAESTASIHHMNFIATPPQGINPRLSHTPMVNEKTGQTVYNWQQHPSRNRFFLRGKLMTGGDTPWAFIGSVTLTLGVAGVWFGTTCVWWWLNESPAVAAVGAYMCLLTVSSMAATAFRDPGILPRNLDPNPPLGSVDSDETERLPLPRDLRVRAGVVRVKYCPTCKTYRPPRSSHCKMCDNCVDGCDHHCQWVNNCIGRRNYTTFFLFLTTAVLTLILIICTTAIHLWLLTRGQFNLTFRQALATSQGVGSAVVFSLSILVIWPVTALFAYHARLLLLNVTTIEQIRMQARKSLVPGPAPPNPFSHGNWRRNLLYVLCRPTGYSWMEFPSVATEDKREINPGLLGEGDDWRRGADADVTLAIAEEGRLRAKDQ
ncbi:DHHC palmitoyltransferase-domain-containing protein [Irpex rosettiformis]|uniref:DHHC palmitoyltransferase-domain-containing protein n=1 Tax=Irpex rosettiformis TaxID=378272 RepID=A0ACB8UGM8_9APHY|nr:DHHC palmitoyltransferase-domain-containing protein [Irpex rosettiformis]